MRKLLWRCRASGGHDFIECRSHVFVMFVWYVREVARKFSFGGALWCKKHTIGGASQNVDWFERGTACLNSSIANFDGGLAPVFILWVGLVDVRTHWQLQKRLPWPWLP